MLIQHLLPQQDFQCMIVCKLHSADLKKNELIHLILDGILVAGTVNFLTG